MELNGRERILERVRSALGTGVVHRGPLEEPPVEEFRQALPRAPEDAAGMADLFAANLAALSATLLRADDEAGLGAALRDLAAREGWRRVAAVDGDPLCAAALTGVDPPPLLCGREPRPREDLAACDAAVTGCELLVAQTGSVLVSSATTGGRSLSVLPPHHVVLATTRQLVPDLSAAMERIRAVHGAGLPSMLSFVTGPSRTADIERILVLGAHGPKKLTVILAGR